MTPRKAEILLTLSRKVRVLSFDQMAAAWWRQSAAGLRAARDTTKHLVDDGWLERQTIHAQVVPVIAPVTQWEVGDPPPDFADVSRRLQGRWSDATVPTVVFLSTHRTLLRFGGQGRGGLKQVTAINHDLHVGAVYLWHRERRPELAAIWRGEDTYRDQLDGEKVPDAILFAPDGTARRVIESGGSYSAERCEEFHESCVGRRIPYDLW